MWEKLNELRRQIEEDYRVDMAALDRLSRHFISAPASISAPGNMPVSNGAHANSSMAKSAPPAPPTRTSDAPERQPDELDGSLRSMFSNYR